MKALKFISDLIMGRKSTTVESSFLVNQKGVIRISKTVMPPVRASYGEVFKHYRSELLPKQ